MKKKQTKEKRKEKLSPIEIAFIDQPDQLHAISTDEQLKVFKITNGSEIA